MLLTFMRQEPYAVQASVSALGAPQAAIVGVVVSANFEVFFDTLASSRKAVNLRVPLSLGRMGLDRIPGLSPEDISDIRQALDQGLTGPILAVDDDGDGNGVRIVLE